MKERPVSVQGSCLKYDTGNMMILFPEGYNGPDGFSHCMCTQSANSGGTCQHEKPSLAMARKQHKSSQPEI